MNRGKSLGFRVTYVHEPSPGLTFAKTKGDMTHAFLGHAFRGRIHVSNGAAPEMTAEVTQLDTLIIETGENARLRALAEQILGIPDTAPAKQVPLTLWCAAVTTALVVWTHVAQTLFVPSTWATPLPSAAAAMFCLGVYSLYLLARHRKGLEGIGLALATVVAAAIPMLSFVH